MFSNLLNKSLFSFFFNSAWCRLEIGPFWATLWTFWNYLAYKNVLSFALHSHKTSKTTWNNGLQTKAPIQCPSVQSQTKAVGHLVMPWETLMPKECFVKTLFLFLVTVLEMSTYQRPFKSINKDQKRIKMPPWLWFTEKLCLDTIFERLKMKFFWPSTMKIGKAVEGLGTK